MYDLTCILIRLSLIPCSTEPTSPSGLDLAHLKNKSNYGGIPYTAHGAEIPPPPLILDFCLFFVFILILG